ncbi:hypothetical protein LZ30DRAFT_426957 [Colletotrichum cereale]|nr:hypothetical protein LZ30DRAFT_426957 [Colletotrichum cereale]
MPAAAVPGHFFFYLHNSHLLLPKAASSLRKDVGEEEQKRVHLTEACSLCFSRERHIQNVPLGSRAFRRPGLIITSHLNVYLLARW